MDLRLTRGSRAPAAGSGLTRAVAGGRAVGEEEEGGEAAGVGLV